MPTYEYECGVCGHVFEAFQSMSDKKFTNCPECQKPKLHRLIGSGSGVVFKGSGFYETDYKQKDKPDQNSCPAKASDKKCSGCPAVQGD
ncbi:MAG: zinc ribbon domain-containing protein [Candidatus Omnitrophica bacterium]|nr:zinc ribbon domain-containing protein [Candidatus Omnitrophota bacterium]